MHQLPFYTDSILSWKMKTVPTAGCPKTGHAFSRFSRNLFLSLQWTQMSKFLAALMEKTGLRTFFTGVTVELPAYFLPNFRVVEIHSVKHGARVNLPDGR